MDDQTVQLLFALLRSAIRDTKMTPEEFAQYTPTSLEALQKLASRHDVAHLLALGLKCNQLAPNNSPLIQNNILRAVLKHERRSYALAQSCKILEDANIPFIPLKGSVLCNLYPEAWMRTRGDIDILVQPQDVERAKSALMDRGGYIYQGKKSHDISLFTPANVHLELHYDLIEDGIAKQSAAVLRSVWDTAVLRRECHHWYEMPDEMFYFYHIAHMAKHFENGGCGIRPFVDLWILDNIPGTDHEKRDALLRQGDLLRFANAARKLSRIWFDKQPTDPLSQQMEDYLLRGGVYGNSENRISVQQQKKGGRAPYALSKIFLPYDELKFHYPVLENHRWLTPFMEVRRWCKLIFCGHLSRTVKELQYNQSISADEAEVTRRFLSNIGLYRP